MDSVKISRNYPKSPEHIRMRLSVLQAKTHSKHRVITHKCDLYHLQVSFFSFFIRKRKTVKTHSHVYIIILKMRARDRLICVRIAFDVEFINSFSIDRLRFFFISFKLSLTPQYLQIANRFGLMA